MAFQSPFILAWISFCLCSFMTCSENSSLLSHLPSLLSIWLYFESYSLQLSMVSPKFSVIELPSLMLCSCCRQLMAMEKICLADCNTLPLCLLSCLMSLSLTVLCCSLVSRACCSCSECILSSTNLVYNYGILSRSSSDLGAFVTRKASTRSQLSSFFNCSVLQRVLVLISYSKVLTDSFRPL